MRTLLVFALLCGVAFATLSVEQQFDNWVQQHGKVYSSVIEKHFRLSAFRRNLARIEELNAEGGAVFAVNEFADMSPREFRDTVLMKPIERVANDGLDAAFVPAVGAPATFDWRDKKAVTAVKNQGQCGSCWAFSATEAIESAWILANRSSDSINLSPQQIVDCDKADSGCNGGWPDKAMTYVHNAGGQEGAAHYAYTAKDGACAFNAQYVEAKVGGFKTATTTKDETTMQNNLINWGPLSICLDASKWQTYASGVLSPTQCCTGSCSLDHCVQLVGYNSTANPPYWIVRNSWGAGWGINGYIHLQMGGNTCALTNHATWPTIA